jgi:hypothetical protein
MSSNLNYAAILTLAVAGATWSSLPLLAENGVDTSGENARAAVDQAQDAANAGIKNTADLSRKETTVAVDEKTASDIGSRIASIINNAVSRNGFDDMIGSLDKQTRDRIGLERFKDFDKLNSAVDVFRANFHNRYQQDFELKSILFKDTIPVNRGPDKDHAAISLRSFDMHEMHAGNSRTDEPDRDAKTDDTHKNMDLNFVIEGVVGNGWRLQTPATLSAQQLSETLYNELTHMANQLSTLPNDKNRWPTDVNEAYLRVSQRLLRAIENPQPANVTAENR